MVKYRALISSKSWEESDAGGALGLGCPSQEALHHIAIFELVVHRIAMVGAWLLQELVKVVISRRALILVLGRRDLDGGGRSVILLVLPTLVA